VTIFGHLTVYRYRPHTHSSIPTVGWLAGGPKLARLVH